jgi:hypothetical protein
MWRSVSRSGHATVREPSPPFEHVSWHEWVDQHGVAHDAADDMVLLAETVMARERVPRDAGVPAHLAKIARYPLWAISVRALVGAAVLVIPLFLYGGTRYHYFSQSGGRYHVDQNALLAGVAFAFVGSLVGSAVGALWGLLVVRYARGSVRRR